MGRSSYQNTLSKHGPTALTAVLVLCGMYASSRYSFFLFHNLVELIAALVAFLVFVLAWNTRHVQDNRYLLFIGIAFLSSGILILAHSLASTGISIFPAPDADRSTQFWIAYRYLLSISFLLAPLFIKRQLRTGLTIGAYGLLTFLLVHAVVVGWFPHCYIEGSGMTLFKTSSEYAIAILLLAALVLLYRARAEFDRSVHLLMSGSIAASLLSALSYTRYVSVAGPESLAGHFFELLATYLIYRAVVVTGVVDPSSLLFRGLKQSEERLRHSEERYRSLVELSPDAIVVHCERKVVYSNTAGLRLFGVSSDGEIIGRDILELVQSDYRDMVKSHIHESYEERVPAPTQEIRILRVDGQPVDVEIISVPTMHGDKPASQSIFRDITERKQAEKRIEYLASFPRLNPNPVLEIDYRGTITYMNGAAVSILHLSGSDEASVFIPAELPEKLRTLRQGSDTEVLSCEVEIQGRMYAESIYLSPALTAARIYAIDITDRKRAEEELRKHRDLLEAVVDERTAELRKINDELELEIAARKASEKRIQVTNDLLQLFTRTFSLQEYLDIVVELLQSCSGCSSVGIRINNELGKVPSVSSASFDPDFLASETMLSLTADHFACTPVVSGTQNSQDLSVRTPNGSFSTNNSTKYLEVLTGEQKKKFRDYCVENDITSLAVIPVQYRKQVLGSIHLADKREGMLPFKSVEFLEQMAFIIGETIYRFGMERDLRSNYDALRATEMRYRSLVEGVRDIIFTLRPDGTIVSLSPAFTASTGWTQEEWIGKHFTGLVHPDDVPAAMDIFSSILGGKPTSLFELRARLRSGNYRYFEFKITSEYTSEGLILGSARDVTERKQAEERLSLFINLINQSQDAVYVADPGTSAILELNEAACVSTGYSRNELLKMKVTDLAEHQVDIDHWTEHVASVRGKGFLLVEDRMKRRDGSTFPIEVGVTYLVHEKQDYLVAVIRDISDRKQAEEDHARLASAVEATVEAVVITDSSSGTIQYVNPAFELLTGYTREEALGRTLHFLESGKHDADYYGDLRQALVRDSVWNGTLMNRKKNGNLYFEECTVSPVRNWNGEIINYVYLKRDVTEKLRLESIAESVSAMDNIGSVFAGVRHEIGNPVNSINMILGILRAKLDSLPSETVRDYLAQMTEQIGRVEYILRSLKSFNLYETQDLKNVDIGSFMDNFLRLVRDDFEKKGIALETALDPGMTAKADPRALQQVLLNIFTNAADAVSVGRRPKITTTITRSGGAVHVRVQDNGRGIPPEKMKDIFKPFYTTKPHGTGLGLVIVKKMLARMNGTIGIESTVDAGTVVDIVIPGGTDEGA
jgi:PAS domain S-box-containing protein